MSIHVRDNCYIDLDNFIKSLLETHSRELDNVLFELKIWKEKRDVSGIEYLKYVDSSSKIAKGALAGVLNAQKNIYKLESERDLLCSKINSLYNGRVTRAISR